MPKRGKRKAAPATFPTDYIADTVSDLTPKQVAFANILSSNGITSVDAYRDAYSPVTSSAQNQRAKAAQLKTASVSDMASVIRVSTFAPEPRNPARARAELLDKLWATANHDNLESPTRLKAIDMIGNIPSIDLWDKHAASDDVQLSGDDLLASIADMFTKLLETPAPGDVVVDLAPDPTE